MGLFNRKANRADGGDDASENKKEKGGWRRPASVSSSRPAPSYAHRFADTAFKQQRLKAWQPILTPKTVLPTLFIIGILFEAYADNGGLQDLAIELRGAWAKYMPNN